MNRNLALSMALLLLVSSVAGAQLGVCTVSPVKRIDNGPYGDPSARITEAQYDGAIQALRDVCTIDAEDLPTSCSDGEVLQAASGSLVCVTAGSAAIRSAATDCTAETGGAVNELCLELDETPIAVYACQPTVGDCDTAGEWVLTGDGGSGGSLQVDESDGTPSVSSVTEINFDQSDGFVVTDDTGGSVTLTLGTVPSATAASTATALAANGANCSAGSAPLGVDASGAVESCFDVEEETHATEHEDGGADEIAAEDLATACTVNQILKSDGAGGFNCSADSTGGSPTFDSVATGTNTTATMTVGSGAILRSAAGILGVPTGTSTPGTCAEGDLFWDSDDDQLYVCSATDTWSAAGGSATGEYSPDLYPSTCASCEEWTGDTEGLTWTDGNAGSLTRTVEMDGVTLEVGNETTNLRGRWLDAPSGGTDFVVVTKVNITTDSDTGPGCGIWMLLAGSEATPTDIEIVRGYYSGSFGVAHSSTSGYTSGYTNHTAETSTSGGFAGQPLWLLIDYDATGNTADTYYSWSGRVWRQIDSESTAADPSDVGIFCDANGLGASQVLEGHFEYFRIFTSGVGFSDFIVGGRP